MVRGDSVIKIISEGFHKSGNHESKIRSLLSNKNITHKQQVKFAFYCASGLEHHYDVNQNKAVYEARKKCLDLVAKWLISPELVSKKELDAAAHSAFTAAIYAAAYAAYTVNTAVNAAAYATNAAYAAANAAASNAAAYTTIREKELRRMYIQLIHIILPKDEYKLLKLII
jgi:hypothetical protein